MLKSEWIGKWNAYRQKHSTLDVIRKVLFVINRKLRPVFWGKLRAWYYLKRYQVEIGRRVQFAGLIENVNIGKFNSIYSNCIFHFGNDAKFQTGNHVTFSYNVLVACNKQITIGDDVMIGEFTSIRDSTHVYDVEGTMRGRPDITNEIVIGNNVWVGRGCLIMQGAFIEDGVVVAAHSVVKGRLQANGIYGGTPAVFIRKRTG